MGACTFRGKIAPGTEHSMAGNKTTQTTASVDAYLAAIADPARRADCEALAALMQKVTNEPPKMWGTAIVGFGNCHYVYDSGREGDICAAGFSSRKADQPLPARPGQGPGRAAGQARQAQGRRRLRAHQADGRRGRRGARQARGQCRGACEEDTRLGSDTRSLGADAAALAARSRSARLPRGAMLGIARKRPILYGWMRSCTSRSEVRR